MITNRLSKQARKPDILLEFSNKEELPEILSQFLKICKAEQLSLKRTAIPTYQISFYYVNGRKNIAYEELEMKNVPTELQHAMTIIYMNHLNEDKIILPDRTGVRTLLLREDLDLKYSLEYETQNVDSKKASINFLCDMAAAFINRACSKEVQFFDQRVEQIVKVRKNEANVLKDTWINILYQVPGLGKDKCLKIAEAYPTYQSILKDYESNQQLKNLEIGKSKLGVALAKRIYKVFVGTKYMQSVID